MNKKVVFIIVGIVLMAGGMAGARMKIDTTWHYFGTGVIFGIGLCLLVAGLFFKKISFSPKKQK